MRASGGSLLIKAPQNLSGFLKIFEKREGVQGEGEELLQKFFSLPLLNATPLTTPQKLLWNGFYLFILCVTDVLTKGCVCLFAQSRKLPKNCTSLSKPLPFLKVFESSEENFFQKVFPREFLLFKTVRRDIVNAPFN